MTDDREAAGLNGAEDDGGELCRDIRMELPDDLWRLGYVERYFAGRANKDFAAMDDGRRFLFGVVEVPLLEEGGSFTWGVWVEVAPQDHDAYAAAFQTPAAEGLAFAGRLANDMPCHENSLGAPVEVRCHADRRPEVIVSLDTALGRDAASGITLAEHEAWEEILFGGEDEEDEDWAGGEGEEALPQA